MFWSFFCLDIISNTYFFLCVLFFGWLGKVGPIANEGAFLHMDELKFHVDNITSKMQCHSFDLSLFCM